MHLGRGEWISGVAGIVCNKNILDNSYQYVAQLVFFSQKEGGRRAVYGPYGEASEELRMCRLFAVNGKITSSFGRVLSVEEPTDLGYTGLGAIGFYFKDTGRVRQST